MRYLLLPPILLLSASAFACSCLQRTLAEHYAAAGIVLKGRVIREALVPPGPSDGKLLDEDGVRDFRMEQVREYHVVVKKRWKGGITADTVIVRTPASSAACGIEMKVGESYIILGDRVPEDPEPNAFRTGLCHGTLSAGKCNGRKVTKASKEQATVPTGEER